MKRLFIAGIFSLLAPLVQNAFGTEIYTTGTILYFATDYQSDAVMVQFSSNINAACNLSGVARAYILKSDTQLVSAARLAATQHLTVNVGIDTASTADTIHGQEPFNLTCRVFQIIEGL
jgi:hypothetical protein